MKREKKKQKNKQQQLECATENTKLKKKERNGKWNPPSESAKRMAIVYDETKIKKKATGVNTHRSHKNH